MDIKLFIFIATIFFSSFGYTYQATVLQAENGKSDEIEFLIEKIQLLETKNEDLEQRVERMNEHLKETEKHFNEQIANLKKDNYIWNEESRRSDEFINAPNKSAALYPDRIVQEALKKSSRRIRRSTDGPTNVAFYATVTPHDTNNLGQGQVIIFDNAQTNIGNAYNSRHGYFTAPIDGFYMISITLAGHSNDYFYGRIDVNGHAAAKMIFGKNGWKQTSQTVLLHLEPGDEVSVKNDAYGNTILGDGYSSFSGFLLSDSDPSIQFVGK